MFGRILCAALVLCLLAPQAQAVTTMSTSYTFSRINAKGDMEITQDAFLPVSTYENLGLKAPQDMVVTDGAMYIADTGNKTVAVVDIETGEVTRIGKGVLRKPVGVAVDGEGRIYAADMGNNCAYRFSPQGELEQVFSRPEQPAYGVNNSFVPQKIAPSGDGGVYLVVDGSLNGLVQLDAGGTFMGFLSDTTVSKSLYETLLGIILSDEQLAKMMSYTPDSYGSIALDEAGMVYAAPLGVAKKVQKLNFKGTDLFAAVQQMPGVNNVQDIAIDSEGYLFVLDRQGAVTEISPDGVMLYTFGGSAKEADRVGLMLAPAGLGVDEAGNLYCLDRMKNNVTVFEPTAMHKRIRAALSLYQDGDYDSLIRELTAELKVNSRSYFGHLYLGRAYMHIRQYRLAAEEYALAEDYAAWSEAYWMIRDAWLEDHALLLGGALALVLLVLVWVFSRVRRRPPYNSYQDSAPLKNRWETFSWRVVKRTLVHPIDTAYELRCGHMGDYATSVMLIVLALAVIILHSLMSGMLFSQNAEDYDVVQNLTVMAAAVALFVGGNAFVTSVQDGKGTMRMILAATAYALLPAILILPALTLVSNVLTLHEASLVGYAEMICVGWGVLSLVVMLMGVHEYSLGKTLGTLALTVVFMAVAVIFLSMIYLLLRQLWSFFVQLYWEVIRNV